MSYKASLLFKQISGVHAEEYSELKCVVHAYLQTGLSHI